MGALAILVITATPVIHCGIQAFSQEIQLVLAAPVARTQIRSFPARVPVVVAPAPSTSQKVSPVLQARLRSRDSATLNFIVELREQVDFKKLANIFAENHVSRETRKAWTTEALTQIAHHSQRSLNRILEADNHRRTVESWSNLAIVNSIIVRGRPAILLELASRPEVASLTEEIEGDGSPELVQKGVGEQTAELSSLWPVEMLKAEAAWRQGLNGAGVVVGILDSGASHEHEQLKDNYRGGDSSWFDPLGSSGEPSDVQVGHGTAVLACAVGQQFNGVSGVAPAAKWIAAVGMNGMRYNNLLAMEAANWMLLRGQPDVLIVPWRLPGSGCDGSLRRVVDAWHAAGMVVVFAAGNDGPSEKTDVSPGNYVGLFPDGRAALSVGAVGREGQVYEKSSRGPSQCGPSVFPQVVAPGDEVIAPWPAGSSLYRKASGTSFAAGYVGGAAAILLQAVPDATPEEVEDALRSTAHRSGAPDSSYGFGLVDVIEAVTRLRSRYASIPRPPRPEPANPGHLPD